MMDSEVLFPRLLAVSMERYVNVRQVLSHELVHVPTYLFNDEGTMQKTAQTGLAMELESNCDEIKVLEWSDRNHTARIIEWMALL